MKKINCVVLLIMLFGLCTTYSFPIKTTDYKDFISLDSNKLLLKHTMGYYDNFETESYKKVKIDSLYYYLKTKDSFSLGNTISVYSGTILLNTFHSKEIFNSISFFQSGIEFNNNLLFIKYTSSNPSFNDNLIIYDFRNNKFIDTLFNIYFYNLNGNNIFIYNIFNNRKFLRIYDLLINNFRVLDSTNNLVDFLYIYPFDNKYLKFKSNFFSNEVVILDSSFNYVMQIHSYNNERYDFLTYSNNKLYFKVNSPLYNDRILKFDTETSNYEFVFSNVKQNHVQYTENENFEFLVYDSLLFKKVISRNKKTLVFFTFDLGFANLQYISLDSSRCVYYANTFCKQYKYQFDLNTSRINIDTTILNYNYFDTLIILKNNDHYCAYYYLYSKGRNIKSSKVLMKVYGGFATYQLPYKLGADEEYLLNNGLAIVHTILSGDGNFGWNGFLKGNQHNIINVIDDIKQIANDVYNRNFCKENSIILKGESYGAYIAASTLGLYPNLFDSGILRAGEYSIKEAIDFIPSKIEQFGNYKDSLIQAANNYISPLKNLAIANNKIPELLICNYEYDHNINNETVFKLIEILEKNNQQYYFNLLSGADHLNSRSYFQALNHFYLENLFLLYRLKK